MVNILLLGSTGSIGAGVCNCVRRFPDRFRLVGLTAGKNTAALADRVREFRPASVCVSDGAAQTFIAPDVRMHTGDAGLCEIVRDTEYDLLINALVGAVGFIPTVTALARGKRVALANKESLVIGGDVITRLLDEGKGSLIPIDSEHSAILQCLGGEEHRAIESIILTASGGPFRELALDKFTAITPDDALRHPTWQMGKKITIDSATLINKGFEIIEAHHIFRLPYDRLRVWIHPQSIIHSLVEFHDGAVIAQMGLPDMELPIQYALSYPERLAFYGKRLNLPEIKSLTFFDPDFKRFPCLRLCVEAGKDGGTVPAALNAANEVAVGLFVERKIGFNRIPAIIEKTVAHQVRREADSVETVMDADREARAWALQAAG
jgi:1-deoxy-D-xylulose-5-phosphate reductoisomerase